MTQVTVHTDFTDLNQMAQGLVGRVNDTHVILPGPDPVDVGEWVQFEVTLYDGTPGFAGVGRCVTVVDNGEERLSHQRFDVVIDSLQFDPRAQQVFEHILTLNGTGDGEEAAEAGSYGETAPSYAEDASFEDVSSDFTGSKIEIPQAPSYQEYAEEEATVIGDSQAFAGSAAVGSDAPPPARAAAVVSAPPPPPPAAPSYAPVDEDEDELIDETPATPRPAAAPAFSEPPMASRGAPVAAPGVAPGTHVNGATFAYPQGLTFPDKPPRPELDATRKVSRAPRPR